MIKEYEDILNCAFEAMKDAYAPYSGYHVGACIKTKDGNLIRGVNIENASYGVSNCGERSAVFSAYSQGYRKEGIVSLAIVSDGKRIATPCGACRQVLNELLNVDTPIVLSNGAETMITNMKELLPMSFDSEDLL